MGRRKFVEADHPRWPRGSGDKAGEFRDKGTPDWASRVSDALPIAGGGSIATGLTVPCDECGRVVKVVGSGKRSTHNIAKGERCPGSGKPTPYATAGGETTKMVGTRRQVKDTTRATARSKKKTKPQRPVANVPLDLRRLVTPTHDGVAHQRMQAWQQDARRFGSLRGKGKTLRDRELEDARAELVRAKADDAADLETARRQVRTDMYNAGYDPDDAEHRDDYGWQTAIKTRLPWGYGKKIAMLKERIEDLEAGRGQEGELNWRSFTASELDQELPYSTRVYESAIPFDESRPLAVYGDMLHFDQSWLSYVALDSMEQNIPPEFHREMAKYLARKQGGIWISTSPLHQQDNLGHLARQTPRGWHAGSTWNDVDGVVSGGDTMAVSYTSNTESHRNSRMWSRSIGYSNGNLGNPNTGEHEDPTATLHEFGHLADWAFGGDDSRGRRQRASAARGWKIIWNEVLREAGGGLNPYFRQKQKATKKRAASDAGAEELWADAFGEWTATAPVPLLDHNGVPMKMSEGFIRHGEARGREIALTWRMRNIATTYDIPYVVAIKIDRYFEGIARDLRAGRRTGA